MRRQNKNKSGNHIYTEMTNVNQQELFRCQNWIKPDQRLYHDALTVAQIRDTQYQPCRNV